MSLDPALVFGGIAGLAVWLFMRWRSPKPEVPPLATDPDDPLLLAAYAQAKASMNEFMALARQEPGSAVIKLRFVSSSDQVEHLWAEVLQVVSDNELEVRLVTPPVTHSGHLERVYRCDVESVEDWQVRDATGKVHGGFSQRAMFAIARRDGVKLPKKLLRIEADYID